MRLHYAMATENDTRRGASVSRPIGLADWSPSTKSRAVLEQVGEAQVGPPPWSAEEFALAVEQDAAPRCARCSACFNPTRPNNNPAQRFCSTDCQVIHWKTTRAAAGNKPSAPRGRRPLQMWQREADALRPLLGATSRAAVVLMAVRLLQVRLGR